MNKQIRMVKCLYDKHQYLDENWKALEQWAVHVEGLRDKANTETA